MGDRIKSYKELKVFENAMNSAMKIFEVTKSFPPEEKYSMVDQVRHFPHSPFRLFPALPLPPFPVSLFPPSPLHRFGLYCLPVWLSSDL